MKRFSIHLGALLVATMLSAAPLRAEDPPALAKASPAEKTRLQGLIADALKEGQVSYVDTVIQPATNNALTAAFLSYYGLPSSFKVGYLTLAPANLITRLDQEVRAKKITADVAAIASPPWIYEQVRLGNITKYASPEYAAYEKAFKMGLGKPDYFAFNGAYYFVPMWNGETTKFESTTWRDMAKLPEGTPINSSDPSKSDVALLTYMGMRQVLDLDFFRTVYKMKPTLLLKSELIASRLVSNEDKFALYGMPTRAWQYNQKGAKLEFMRPTEGVVLMTQSMFILENCPHPAAAKLWLDFMLSEPGQKIMAEKEVMISGREGFKSPYPDYVPNLDGVKMIPMEWDKITLESMQKSREEWTSLTVK